MHPIPVAHDDQEGAPPAARRPPQRLQVAHRRSIRNDRTVARISVEASAARVERARWRPDSRHLRQHTRRLAPHRGAHRPTSQRSPRRASTVAVSQPPSLAAHAPPRTTPWSAPAYKPQRSPRRASTASASQPPSSVAVALPRTTPRRAPACKPAQPASGEHGGGLAAAVLGSARAASHHTVARASLQASAARVERARHQPDSRPPRQPTRRLAPYRGARQPTSQRGPRRASTVAASQPPPSGEVALPRTAPWRAPAYKPAQPASSKHGISLTAAVLGSPRAAPRRTAARASLHASAARVERARHQPHSRLPRQPTRRLAPHRGARQPTSQRSPRRASTASA